MVKVDPERLVKIIFTEEGEILGSFFAFKNINAVAVTRDEQYEVPDEYITLDGTIYFQPKDNEMFETVYTLLRYMAGMDYPRYFTFMTNYHGLLPAQAEEELYRFRNMRLAEFGFLPFEEAVAIYTPLAPEKLLKETEETAITQEQQGLVEVSYYLPGLIKTDSLFHQLIQRLKDPLLLDRIRIEFTGLVNQLISAEGSMPKEPEDLQRVVLKASRYLNLSFERFWRQGPEQLLSLLKKHHLSILFRVGVYMVMRVKWETQKWIKGAWFVSKGLNEEFWGDPWGNILKGILAKRPVFYHPSKEGEYREFEWVAELNYATGVIEKIMVLDSLLAKLEEKFPFKDPIKDTIFEELGFKALLFTPWARDCLGLDEGFTPLTNDEFFTFFKKLRQGLQKKPYSVRHARTNFISYFKRIVGGAGEEMVQLLEGVLEELFFQFSDEYENVPTSDLDPRFCPYLAIEGKGIL